MCGILALADWAEPVDPQQVARGLAHLRHRGPDGEGIASRWDGRLALAHRRLAIFDTGAAGRQPMTGAATGDTIVFNGSIYNYPELRAELEQAGHRFVSDSDTEVLLAAWRQWGADAFGRLNGMWALALHDAASDSVVVSRDRLGVKPLYMLRTPTGTAFASEVRALLAATGHRPRLAHDAAFDFLLMGLSDHGGRTMLDGVVEVPPGALWTLSRDGSLRRERYHRWPAAEPHLGAEEVAEELAALLADATALRLRAHVPVAALLSGGLDSGAVAWAVSCRLDETAAGRFVGFTSYGYGDDSPYDERAQARATLRHLGTTLPHHELRADPQPDPADLEAFLAAQELPVGTPSPVAGFRLFRHLAQAGAKVVLTGDGSDELFAGYTRRYLPMALRDAVLGGRWSAAAALARSPHLNRGDAMARAAWSLPRPALAALLARRPHVAVLNRDFREASPSRLDDLVQLQRTGLERQGQRDVTRHLLPQMLRYIDRNSMAWGVEARSPFLDYRVAELAARLPMTAKVGAAGGKAPVRRAMAPHLPAGVVDGAKLRGLGHAEQFQVGRLDLAGLLADPPAAAAGVVDAARLAAALARHPGEPRLWWPVCLLLWLRQVERQWS